MESPESSNDLQASNASNGVTFSNYVMCASPADWRYTFIKLKEKEPHLYFNLQNWYNENLKQKQAESRPLRTTRQNSGQEPIDTSPVFNSLSSSQTQIQRRRRGGTGSPAMDTWTEFLSDPPHWPWVAPVTLFAFVRFEDLK